MTINQTGFAGAVSVRLKPFIIVASAALVGLSACDNPSAVETRDRSLDAAPLAMSSSGGTAAPEDMSNNYVAATDNKPPITANRRETVDAKIARLYERNGADFAARSPDDYLAKVERFTRTPPDDVEKISRPNGDTLLYQASTNTFAVVSRDGTARTMFKPRDGASYWAEQKTAAPDFGRSRNRTSTDR